MNKSFHEFWARGGGWVVVQFILMTAVLLLGVVFHGRRHHDWAIVLGLVLVAVGGYFGIAGVGGLGPNRTPYPRPLPGAQLVQTGIYGRVRHPLYTSVMLVSLGWAAVWQSVASFTIALTLLPFFYAKARREERWLGERFPGYPDYARRVPRFLPRVRSPQS